MNFFSRIFKKKEDNKSLAREVKERAKETTILVTEINTVKQDLMNDPLPNFPISGFLVSAAPRKRSGKG